MLIRFQGSVYLLYRDGSGREQSSALMYALWENGQFIPKGSLAHDCGDGIGAHACEGVLHLFSQQSGGLQLNALMLIRNPDPRYRGQLVRGGLQWMETGMRGRPCAAKIGSRVVVVSRHDRSNALLWNAYHEEHIGHVERGYTRLETKADPFVIAFANKLHLYYVDPDASSDTLWHAESANGKDWALKGDTGLRTPVGVAACTWKDQLVMTGVDGPRRQLFFAISGDGHAFRLPDDPYFGLGFASAPACIADGDTIIVAGRGVSNVAESFDLVWAAFKPDDVPAATFR